MPVIKVGLITTLDTNIGDDFIREGICRVLRELFRGDRIEFVSINKHKPYTVYPIWHPIHLINTAGLLPVANNFLKNAAESLFPKIGYSRFDGCDLIVQCGAPVFWPNCSQNEWARPIWYDIIKRLCGKISVLNLAAGSCYPWERQPEIIESSEDAEYVKSILGYCRLTTVRDRLAQSLCKSLGNEVQLVPCSAFLAAYGRRAKFQESSYILINYMAGGGHYDWEQGIDSLQWEKTISEIILRLRKRHAVAFLCHDEKEVSLSRKIAPDLQVFFPKTSEEYFACVSHAKFGLFNRMHASVAVAGMGVPSVAVCTDTRLLMVSQLGLPVHYVKNVDADILEEETENALKSLTSESERLLLLQAKTWEIYATAIQEAFCRL